MATYIKDLVEDNGDITRPVTEAGAVLLSGGGDLETELTKYVTAEDIATTSALTPPVQTNMIADGAVATAKVANGAITGAKINFSSITNANLATIVPEDLSSLVTPVTNSWSNRDDIKLYRYGNVFVMSFINWWVASIAANKACNMGTINKSVLGSAAPIENAITVINGDNGYIMNNGRIYINASGQINGYCATARNGATCMRGQITWIYKA